MALKPNGWWKISRVGTTPSRARGALSSTIVPIFGFANAGVSFAGMTPSVLVEPVTLGVAMGLFIGLLAFADPGLQDAVKVGVLAGSLVSALIGAWLLSVSKRRTLAPTVEADIDDPA